MATVCRLINGSPELVNDPAADLYWHLVTSGVWAWQLTVHELSRTPAGQARLRDLVGRCGPSEAVALPGYLRDVLRVNR